MAYEYQFTSTVDDLLEAERTEWSSRTVRPPLRWLIAASGTIWIVAGVIALASGKPLLWPLIWIGFGLSLVYFFGFKTFIRRAQIKRLGAGCQKIALLFGDDSLRIEACGREFVRKWEDFRDFVSAAKGVLFYFADGTANWLPDRVFVDKAERMEFLDFVNEHMPEKR